MKLHRLDNEINRSNRNKLNENMSILENEYSNLEYDVNSYKKDIAENSRIANEANINANKSVILVSSIQSELDNLVIEGDSSVEAAQARTNTITGETYINLRSRLDEENEIVTEQLLKINVELERSVHPIVEAMRNEFTIMAHRGSLRGPENTLEGFWECVKRGVKYIETDFRRSSDGHWLCIHDTTTNRTSSTQMVVANSTLEQLKTVRQDKLVRASFYDNPKIPTLDEVLRFTKISGCIMNTNFDGGIDREDIPFVIEKIYEYGVESQVIVPVSFMEFDDRLCITPALDLTDEAFENARKMGNMIPSYNYGSAVSNFLEKTKFALKLASKHKLPLLTWNTTNYNHWIELDRLGVNVMMVDDYWIRGSVK